MQVEGKTPLRIGLIAPEGRVGIAIAAEVACLSDVALSEDQAEVLIDFSAPEALAGSLDRARAAAIPIVIGTTGHDALAERRLDEAAAKIAVLQSANMSLGVNLLSHLVRQAAARLGTDWDIEILEMHHAAKKDAPSGTALLLGDAAARGRGMDPRVSAASIERAGGERRSGSIGYASLRGGTVAGDHDVIFAGPSERILLSHRAESRAIFAHGAIVAARWIARRPPGRYTMADVLGLE